MGHPLGVFFIFIFFIRFRSNIMLYMHHKVLLFESLHTVQYSLV